MATSKPTKREIFGTTISILEQVAEKDGYEVEVLVDGLKHEIELLDRKRTGSKGQDAKRAAEQREYMALIAGVMADTAEPMRAGDIAKATDLAVQRVSALLKKMVDAGAVAREQDKKVVTFTLV
jgi:DNA-binding MarR family transcriptional regulator